MILIHTRDLSPPPNTQLIGVDTVAVEEVVVVVVTILIPLSIKETGMVHLMLE